MKKLMLALSLAGLVATSSFAANLPSEQDHGGDGSGGGSNGAPAIQVGPQTSGRAEATVSTTPESERNLPSNNWDEVLEFAHRLLAGIRVQIR